MKQIIILEQHPANGGVSQLNVLFWFAVAAGREVLNSGAASRYRGATDVENGEIAAGRVVEEAFTHMIPPNTNAATIRTQLQAIYATRKALHDAKPNPNQFYGVSWDGTAWG